jgi:hypothetical protein
METAKEETPIFLDQLEERSGVATVKQSQKLTELFKELIKHGQDKVKLATVTYDIVWFVDVGRKTH